MFAGFTPCGCYLTLTTAATAARQPPRRERRAAASVSSSVPMRSRIEVVTDIVCHDFVEGGDFLYDERFAVTHELHSPKQR